jgi:hypothetical protein
MHVPRIISQCNDELLAAFCTNARKYSIVAPWTTSSGSPIRTVATAWMVVVFV